MEKIKVGVIFGGQSTEHDVSVVSGSSVIKNLSKEKYEIYPIYISEKGEWFHYIKPAQDIDIFEINGEYYISEVNPRFGGGYPHAYESGANHMKFIMNNLRGKRNVSVVGENYEEGTYMMKYNEVMVRKEV